MHVCEIEGERERERKDNCLARWFNNDDENGVVVLIIIIIVVVGTILEPGKKYQANHYDEPLINLIHTNILIRRHACNNNKKGLIRVLY